MLAPNAQIQSGHTSVEAEKFKFVSIFVVHVHVDGQNSRASRNLGWFKVKELWVNQLKFANCEGYVIHMLYLVNIQDSQVSLQELQGSGKIEIEAKLDKNLSFKVCEGFFVDTLLFFLGQEMDHSGEAWRYWLLQLC